MQGLGPKNQNVNLLRRCTLFNSGDVAILDQADAAEFSYATAENNIDAVACLDTVRSLRGFM